LRLTFAPAGPVQPEARRHCVEVEGELVRTVHPELQRFAARLMGATIYETDSSHVRMLSQPSVVLDVIRAAATVIRGFAVGVA